jgi:hypothetical protein
MKKLLNWLGLCYKSEYESLNRELKLSIKESEDRIASLEDRIKIQDKNYRKLPFDFTHLLSLYNEARLNALFYELVNNVRNDKSKSHLLERWQKRLTNAEETLQK